MSISALPAAQVPPPIVDDRMLEQLTPIRRSTWQRYRRVGGGPPFVKVGGHRCLYRWADVVAWLEAQRVGA